MAIGAGIGVVLGAILGGAIASQTDYSIPFGIFAGLGVFGVIGLAIGAMSR